jgi:HSP20 family molecular chaperone IbpA
MAANTAPVKWAQRKDSLYLTIALPDVKDHQVELTDRKLVFQGTSGDKLYKLDLEFVSSFIRNPFYSQQQRLPCNFLIQRSSRRSLPKDRYGTSSLRLSK